MIVKSLKITGTGAAVPLSSSGIKAKWVQLAAGKSNAADILVGGSEVTSSVGYPLGTGGLQFTPPISDMYEFYVFAKIFAYIANADVLHVLYAVDGAS